ncbi:MAG: glycoside hydrolase family 16 protein [Chitinivibrionales bacterium]|nr:glycoside hydrolase family 16 protein [Chitinivibrionales bacterium]
MKHTMLCSAMALLGLCCHLFASMPSGEPPAIAGQGYGIVMYDDFDNPTKTVDFNNTCAPGYNWYVRLPIFYGSHATSGTTAGSGVLTVTGGAAGWSVGTYPLTKGNTAKGYKHGYFEARMRFDPTLGPSNSDWPAWWLFSVSHSLDSSTTRWGEYDIFEAYTGGRAAYDSIFVGTAHDWWKGNHLNSNNVQPMPPGTDFNQWHTYAFLWEADSIAETGYFKWYFDDSLLITVTFAKNGLPTPFVHNANGDSTPVGCFWIGEQDTMGMIAILGSSRNWPLQIDGVRIWQKGPGAAASRPVAQANSFSYQTMGNIIRCNLAKPAFVSIKYFDLLGRTVCSFVNNVQPQGYHAFNAPVASLPRNVYIREFRAGDFVKQERWVAPN